MPKKTDIDTIRHSLAHIMAKAVKELYPGTKLGIGPTIEDGFYYDFETPLPISDKDLSRIEKRMRQIVSHNEKFVRKEYAIPEAEKLFRNAGENLKLELIRELANEGEKRVSVYETGNFFDLCRGPHVKSANEVGEFKLTHVAGAYWRGDEKNPQLQRIYGIGFLTKKELDEYILLQEEIKKRDHRRLGQLLDLFTHSEHVGQGLPLLTERGTFVVNLMISLVKKLQEPLGYHEVRTPHLTRMKLYEISGHKEKFPDLFTVSSKEKEELALKPVNCPHHTQLYARRGRSYRDLPIKTAEFSTLYRDELSGTLGGLTRVRALTQDDAHIFCSEDQVENEFDQIFGMIKKLMETYGLKYRLIFSTHDPKNMKAYLGSQDVWKKSEGVMHKILNKRKIKFTTALGEAAIYGPKLDLMAEDSLGREWQLSTIQLDFNMPERFELAYTDLKGEEARPVMIHRALHGTFERFLGILIEHYAGEFPFWLAPEQVRVIPVSDKHIKYAEKLAKQFDHDTRYKIDDSNNTVGKKIREAELLKVPYMVVVGDQEAKNNSVTVRTKGSDKTQEKKIKSFIDMLNKEKNPLRPPKIS